MKYTREQLEAMSDFEINCILATINGSKKTDAHCNRGVIQTLKNAVMTDFGVKDYCNNWSDTGVLIDECNIDLQHDRMGNGMHFASDWDDVFVSSNSNIKRAATMVYILIKQGEM